MKTPIHPHELAFSQPLHVSISVTQPLTPKPTNASELVRLAVQGLQSLNPQSPLRKLMNIAPASQPLTRR